MPELSVDAGDAAVEAILVVPSWSAAGPLNTARSAHTATRLQNGKVLVVGGRTGLLYDPSTNI